ncbi:SUMF1/EgtB/PvdO family nonheme iron enzyme [Muricoccus radiodurans]|uniref:formylglycine-generating enzyme family protein n=1 Tax=Muricoccus radiodurans TaxID=2231721 RepID=UPI003CF1EB84
MEARAAAWCRELVARLSGAPAAIRPRPGKAEIIPLEAAHQSPLVDWTDEDAAAKGLRSLREAPRERPRPVHHTALERAAAEPCLLLTGEAGSGRTTFLRHLASYLAGEIVGDPAHGLRQLSRPVPRGEDGTVREERWNGPPPIPVPLRAEGPVAPDALLHAAGPDAVELVAAARNGLLSRPLLLLLDDADRLGGERVAEWVAMAAPGLRLLMTATAGTLPGLPGLRRHALLPWLPSQRRAFRAACGAGDDPPGLPDRPGLLSLTVAASGATPETLVGAFVAACASAAGLEPGATSDIHRTALGDALPPQTDAALRVAGLREALGADFLAPYLAAQALAAAPPDEAARRAPNPLALRLLSARYPEKAADLVAAVLDAAATPEAALTAAGLLTGPELAEPLRTRLTQALLDAAKGGGLMPERRAEAGRHLALLGDPRDLEELVPIPAGPFTMGSAAHPNSAPPHPVTVGAYRIGRHPATNRVYRRFVEETGRPWASAEGRQPARANAPAVDLTWRDARAFCEWITPRWRAEGRIAPDEIVRLPTEPEWERAARGPAPATHDPPYPYPGPWRPGRANDETAGLNDTCAVGLFPEGRSAEGAEDLCGGVWEWCSTLWGEDMANPSFRYPYAPDGREDAAAGPTVRRVLRGGCFSSAPEKASATYRGSLEPDGFWRGNGFRVVVARG